MNSEKLKKAVEEILKEDGFEFDEIVEVSNVKNTSDFVTGAASSIPNPAKIVFSYTSKKEVEAKVALRHAGAHAFAHRKDKKTDMRRLFTVRLNAALRALGITYSKFISLALAKNVQIDRKILSQLADTNPETFKKIVDTVTA